MSQAKAIAIRGAANYGGKFLPEQIAWQIMLASCRLIAIKPVT